VVHKSNDSCGGKISVRLSGKGVPKRRLEKIVTLTERFSKSRDFALYIGWRV
jgi:hypothetical protein